MNNLIQPADAVPQYSGGIPLRRSRRHWGEKVIVVVLFFCGFISVITTVAIIISLLDETVKFFSRPEVRILGFFTGTVWTPQYAEAQRHFGVLPLINGTFLIALGAALVGLPLGLMSAIYLSEYASSKTRDFLKPILEILAGVPTVVYGFFGLTFVTPLLKLLIPSTGIFNAASASIVVGIMILPMISSLSEDALHAVPRSLREAAFGLGATKFETSVKVVVPAALSGIIASFILGVSRAVGETMAVAIAGGMMAQMTFNPLKPVMAMTAYIVNVSLGDTPYGSVSYESIFAVAMLLFLITLLMNIISNAIMKHYREIY
jgi:phosphate transport system permease protein